jgi:hypothetical protein
MKNWGVIKLDVQDAEACMSMIKNVNTVIHIILTGAVFRLSMYVLEPFHVPACLIRDAVVTHGSVIVMPSSFFRNASRRMIPFVS